MAFKTKNLRVIGDNATAGEAPALWLYYNVDSDTVTTAGYIPESYGIKAKDMVAVIPTAGTSMAWYHVVMGTGGKLVLTANS
jgi:hypothetical protein